MIRRLKGFYMSLGMFSAIPLPVHVWDESLTKIMAAAFPMVGLIIGVIWWAVGLAVISLNFPLVIGAAILAVLPFLLYGFIHLDGYMDTSDAHLSRRPFEEKLRILKDPNVGAFAVIMLAVLFLLQFAAVYTIAESGRFLALFIAISVFSRCCSAFSIFTLRHSPQSNYAAIIGQGRSTGAKIFVIITALGTIAFAFLYAEYVGLIVILAVILGFTLAMRTVYKNFKGVSGDLLGYCLVIGELCGLIALALLQGFEVGI